MKSFPADPELNVDEAAGPQFEVVEADVFDDAALDYRALSTPALVALALGILSPLAFIDWWLGVIPFLAIVIGVVGLRQTRLQSTEYTGGGFAIAGMALAAVCWIGGASLLGYIYATELPEGHERLYYSDLQPRRGESPHAVPQDALQWDGKDVLIKGYMYPGMKQDGITQFLLVRDKGDCCFGGDPKITDRIQVTLSPGEACNFSGRLFKIAGKFRISPPVRATDASGAVFYHLDEATLR